jgi:hypothetical protein
MKKKKLCSLFTKPPKHMKWGINPFLILALTLIRDTDPRSVLPNVFPVYWPVAQPSVRFYVCDAAV